MHKNISYTLSDNFCKLNNTDKALILGCGCSTHETSKNELLALVNLLRFPNVTLSDFNISPDTSSIHYNIKNIEYELDEKIENILPIYFDKYISSFYHHMNINMNIDISERFIKFDLLNDDFDSLEEYDFIQLKHVLHFRTLQNKRIDIIASLFNKLKPGGNLFIKIYTELNEYYKTNWSDYYSVITEEEIDIIRSTYKNLVIDKYTIIDRHDIRNNNSGYIIVITKL